MSGGKRGGMSGGRSRQDKVVDIPIATGGGIWGKGFVFREIEIKLEGDVVMHYQVPYAIDGGNVVGNGSIHIDTGNAGVIGDGEGDIIKVRDATSKTVLI